MPKLGPNLYSATWTRARGRLDSARWDDAWETPVAGIEGRFRERFLKPADAILDLDMTDTSPYPEGRGFAVLALDCLLLEALHGFEVGKRTESSKRTSEVFARLLTTKTEFADAFKKDDLARSFASSVRNGLLHDGETRHGWLVRQGSATGAIVRLQGDWHVLNRDAFHRAVKLSLEAYFRRLRDGIDPESVKLRHAFIERVDMLCEESEPTL